MIRRGALTMHNVTVTVFDDETTGRAIEAHRTENGVTTRWLIVSTAGSWSAVLADPPAEVESVPVVGPLASDGDLLAALCGFPLDRLEQPA